jgi:hypothetical protein
MDVAPMLPTSLRSRGWALYLFFWPADRYPFDFDNDANPDSFVRVATFAWPYIKPDGTEAFAEAKPVFARKDFEIGGQNERGFIGRDDWFSLPKNYKITVLRPDRVLVMPGFDATNNLYPIQDVA